jgi:ubiquinone/menaquinone biosynthesis C-methylase UbiE
MNTSQAYNAWSASYDEVENKTRDLEAKTIRTLLGDISFKNVLELGCGTGKNTEWLSKKAEHVTAVDFSPEMMERAKEKVGANATFRFGDITKSWDFADKKYDLITCSLILEHVQDLNFVFEQAAAKTNEGAFFYIGELHPFKQYNGSKARFETNEGTFTLECYVHHISNYINSAKRNGFECVQLLEPSDDGSQEMIPRIAAFLFKKTA